MIKIKLKTGYEKLGVWVVSPLPLPVTDRFWAEGVIMNAHRT